MKYDVAIVGGGIVGLSTAYHLQQRLPQARLLVLEKEADWAWHQSGHNSGVIHSGIYYTPGSLRARFAREGSRKMAAFCREHGIRHDVCGKVIVATEPDELPRLEALYTRGQENGVEASRLTPEALKEFEPHAVGLAALQVPGAGIADYPAVAHTFARLLQEQGADLRLNARVEKLIPNTDGVTLAAGGATFEAGFLVTCAGLQSDRIARMAGVSVPTLIVPFRGEYFTLKPQARHLVRNLIYPVPNPAFPFLGVHFTRMVDGEIHAGPNAVLGLKRESYRKWDFSPGDFLETLAFSGFRRLAARHWRIGLQEMERSFCKAAFVRSLQRLIPEITAADISPAPAGVRAMALLPEGKMVDDFVIVPGVNALHVCNAPSPAATASLEIGDHVAQQVAENLSSLSQ